MCDSCNKPNCGCSPCQECNNPVPQTTCTTTCTCTTDQFSQDCPCGQVGSNCVIYTGDTLQDCNDDDYIFRGTTLNTFLSQLWETVKCAATATTDTIDYTGADIKDCDNNITIVPTNTPVTIALNNIWNYIKCWYKDLTLYVNDKYDQLLLLISNRQPIWKAGYPILVDSSLFAPFNNINTAITEITKYHHDVNGPVRVRLGDGTHTLNATTFANWNSQSGSFQLESSAPGLATLNIPNGLTIDSFNLILRGININGNIVVTNGGNLVSNSCFFNQTDELNELILIQNSSNFTANDSRFQGLNTSNSQGIFAKNNSQVNIFTSTTYQEPYYSNFYTLFEITQNSSLVVNNASEFQAENIHKILNLFNNSKASFTGAYCEFSGVNANFSDSVGFKVQNNSILHLENINLFGLYNRPIVLEYNSHCTFSQNLLSSTKFGVQLGHNSSFTGNTTSNLTISIISPGNQYYFEAYHNSNINLAYSSVTCTGSPSLGYFLLSNSKMTFLDGSISPLPSSSNTYVGSSPTAMLIPNTYITSSSDPSKLGCALLLY